MSLAHLYEQHVPEELSFKRISNYLLLTEAHAITLWHTDFSASCVFYAVVSGVKEFYVIPATPENHAAFDHYLALDKRLVTSLDCQYINSKSLEFANTMKFSIFSELFFAHHVGLNKMAKRIVVMAGQGLVLPAGIIHMVRTPVTSVALGINFLHINQLSEF